MLRRTFLSTALLGPAAAVAADSIDGAPRLPAWPLPHRPLAPFAQAGIWDSFYWGSWQERASAESLVDALAAERPANMRAGIARQCIHLHVGADDALRSQQAFRLQSSVPELTNLRSEPPEVWALAAAGDVCLQLPAGAPHGSAACVSHRSSIAAGTRTTSCPRKIRGCARTSTSRASRSSPT